jgi:carbamoyltransferase
MLILGISSFEHDTAAALLSDGEVVAAIENDKLERSTIAGVPDKAIQFCLTQAGASWHELDAIAVATSPLQRWLRRSMLPAKLSQFSPMAYAHHGASELGSLVRDLSHFRTLRQSNGNSRDLRFEHHLCHAANAYYLSPFDRALVVTIDEEGDGNSVMIAIAEGNAIRVLRRIAFPNSPAWVYSQVTELLGFAARKDEHKTQWLSLGGEPVYKAAFLEMLRAPGSCLPRLNRSFFNPGLAGSPAFSPKFYRQLDLPTDKAKLDDDQRRALASSMQAAIADVVAELVDSFRDRENVSNVCLAGGLMSNTLLVATLEQRLGMNEVFVPPAPGNAGCAMGAAMLTWHQTFGKPRHEPQSAVYWGPSYSRSEIKEVLDNCKVRYSLQNTEDRKLDTALQLLQAGKIVGWYQGATEFGPRSLGNRSILASPWAPYVRENLNDFIKHREWFRPFALAVPEEDAGRFFQCSQLCRSMNTLGKVLPESVELFREFMLPGDFVRLHVVTKDANPHFWRLLKRFGEQEKAPVLVNTSFNLFGEPMVVKPRDAVRSYFCSGIDALIIDNFVLSKSGLSQSSARLAS